MGTPIECLYLLLLAQSFHGFSFQTVLGDHHCPLSIFGTALLYFSLADFGVRRLKKRLEDATVQASDHLSTDPEVADYLSQSDRQLQKLSYFLEHSPAQFPIYRNTEVTYFPLGDDMLPAY